LLLQVRTWVLLLLLLLQELQQELTWLGLLSQNLHRRRRWNRPLQASR